MGSLWKDFSCLCIEVVSVSHAVSTLEKMCPSLIYRNRFISYGKQLLVFFVSEKCFSVWS